MIMVVHALSMVPPTTIPVPVSTTIQDRTAQVYSTVLKSYTFIVLLQNVISLSWIVLMVMLLILYVMDVKLVIHV